MERSKTIHIINLNHFLEWNKIAQELLEINKKKEPNMEFKIWTEEDKEIKEALDNLPFPVLPKYMSFIAGSYLSNYILAKFGGVYCEMDYEFKKPNFFYNLYKSDIQFACSSVRVNNFSINCGTTHYFPFPNNQIVVNNLKLLLKCLDEKTIDWEACSFESAQEICSSQDISKIVSENAQVGNNIYHYSNFGYATKNLFICSLKKFLEIKKTKEFLKIFNGQHQSKILVFRNSVFEEYEGTYYVTQTSDINFILRSAQLFSKCPEKRVILLSDDDAFEVP